MDSPALRVFVLKMTRAATVLKVAFWRREPGVFEEPQSETDARGRFIPELAFSECSSRENNNDPENREFE